MGALPADRPLTLTLSPAYGGEGEQHDPLVQLVADVRVLRRRMMGR